MMPPLYLSWLRRIKQTLARRKNSKLRNQVPTPLQEAERAWALARRELIAAEHAGDTRRIGAAFVAVKRAKTEWLRLAVDQTTPRIELRA